MPRDQSLDAALDEKIAAVRRAIVTRGQEARTDDCLSYRRTKDIDILSTILADLEASRVQRLSNLDDWREFRCGHNFDIAACPYERCQAREYREGFYKAHHQLDAAQSEVARLQENITALELEGTDLRARLRKKAERKMTNTSTTTSEGE